MPFEPEKTSPLPVLVLGDIDGLKEILDTGIAVDGRPVHPHRVHTLQEFEALDLNDYECVVTDTEGLGLGAVGVINAIKEHDPCRPVVMLARSDQATDLARAMRAGLDEFLLNIPESGFKELFTALLARALDRKRRELPALLAAQMGTEHFWTFFDSAPVPMKVLDCDGTLLHANDALGNFLHTSPSKLVGRSIFEVMHEDEVDQARKIFEDLISRGRNQQIHQAEYNHHLEVDRRYRASDGTLVWGNLFLLALWNTDGSIRHVLGIIVDVTARVLAINALEEREAHERAILNTTVDGILTMSAEGCIETFNPACERIFGYPRDEVIGQDIQLLMPGLVHNLLDEVLANEGQPIEAHELQGYREEGTPFPVEVSIGQMRFAAQRKYTAIVRDVSERNQLLERLQRSQRMEAVGQLAGGVSHDFNNLLTIINTYAYLLESRGLSSTHEETYLRKILAATERGARLTGQLMSLTPTSLTEARPILLNHVIGELETLFQSVIEEDITLVTDLDPNLSFVEADLGQVEQIFMNLIINAREAMPYGGTITVRTCDLNIKPHPSRGEFPSELPCGNYALLEVHDTGLGMTPEVRDQVFEPFFSTKTEGTGLGLATVYSIVRRHGGTIEVHSAPNVGSTFRVYLPALPREPLGLTTASTISEDHPPKPRPNMTMLLVEDEDDLRISLAGVFEQEGFKVLAAANGEEALTLAIDHPDPIDVLLTDIVMPGMNGVELAEQLSELQPDLRVIFVSGYAGDALLRKHISPRRLHVSKPYKIVHLKQVVHSVLEH